MASIGINDIKIYLTNLDGTLYYKATLNQDGTYSVPPPSAVQSEIFNLPVNWYEAEINYKRHPEYWGVFRSESKQFRFVKDARAILLNLYYSIGGFIEADCVMRIDIFIDVFSGYKTVYKSEIDFSSCSDSKDGNGYSGLGGNSIKDGEFEVNTLDSRLFLLLQSFGDTKYNIPIWKEQTPGDWLPYDDVDFVIHNGIKLLYSANYVSAAQDNATNILNYTGDNVLFGWNKGARGSGFHTIPSLAQYNIVQNNGTTTFIGNDILQPFLIQGNQNPGAEAFANEDFFNGTNHSRPYSTNNNSLKNLLPNLNGNAEFNVSMEVQFSNGYSGGLPVGGSPKLDLLVDGANTQYHLSFVLFEINNDDSPSLTIDGRFVPPVELLRIQVPDPAFLSYTLPNGGYFNTISSPISTLLSFDKAYVFGIIFDNLNGSGSTIHCGFQITKLQFTLFSKQDGGLSGVPIPAPSLNSSVFPAMRLNAIFARIVSYLSSTETDSFGFPIINTEQAYTGTGGRFLSSLTAIGDLIPNNVMITSAYCIHDLQGQSYISCSLNQIFNFCKKILGGALSIGLNGDSSVMQISSLSSCLDKNTMSYDLGTNVAKMKIKPFNEISGCNLKLGYQKADTNSDFGVDPFITELFFNTPLIKLSQQTVDLEESGILCEQYAIEKIRAQRVSQPIGTGYDPANPSSDNECIAFYCGSNSVAIDPQLYPYDPSNTQYITGAYPVLQRNGLEICGSDGIIAQSNDPSANSQPYVFGMYYPDSAINLEFSPARILKRDMGALVHSSFAAFDEKNLVFRNTSVIQYNNSTLDLASIQSNLKVGSAFPEVITEFKDIQISSLPDKLFMPYLISIETIFSIDFYNIINNNPNGYIRFIWKGIEFKGFIWSVSQKLISKPTIIELIAHPDTTYSQLINS